MAILRVRSVSFRSLVEKSNRNGFPCGMLSLFPKQRGGERFFSSPPPIFRARSRFRLTSSIVPAQNDLRRFFDGFLLSNQRWTWMFPRSSLNVAREAMSSPNHPN